jgi:hypothetical protein
MRKISMVYVGPVIVSLSTVLWFAGCADAPNSKDGGPVAAKDGEHFEGDGHDHEHEGDAHSEDDGHDHGDGASAHSGWWCNEHGIPEGECSMCSSKVAAAFQKKGDWCQEHDRAKSQCFICDPAAKEKYAAKYRAKYGKEPPAIEDEGT